MTRYAASPSAAIVALAALLLAPAVPSRAEFQVNSYTTDGQRYPDVAADAQGDFVIVWSSYRTDGGYTSAIFGQRYDSSGSATGTEFLVSSTTAAIERFPAVASDDAGRFMVVWDSFPGQDYQEILARVYDSTGAATGAAFQINAYTTGTQQRADVTTGPAGEFIVAWTDYGGRDGDGGSIFARRYDSSGSALGTEFQGNTTTVGGQREPRLSSSADGAFVAMWEDDDVPGLFAQRYDSSATALGSEFQIASGAISGSLACHDDGSFVAVWANGSVFGQRYDGDGLPLGTEFQPDDGTGRESGRLGGKLLLHGSNSPDVASDGAGNFMVVWGSLEVLARRYDASGTAVDAEFQVNSYTTSIQNAAALAASPAGDFVVAWSSFAQDGDGYGIFGERYADAVSACPDQPHPPGTCLASSKGQLVVANKQDDDKDQLKWSWVKGQSVDQAELGDPISGSSYSLCVYDSSGGIPALVAALVLGPGAEGWTDKTPKGLLYKDKAGEDDGIVKVVLKTGGNGKSKALLVAKGAALPTPEPASGQVLFDQEPNVVVELVSDTTSTCWVSEFFAAKKNAPETFKAKTP